MRKYSPMLAFLGKAFDSKDHIFEIKYDGTRAVCYIDGGMRFINRRDAEITYRYPEFPPLRRDIKAKTAVIDGEIVVFQEGRPDFPSLAAREHISGDFKIKMLSKKYPATYVVFDILMKDGKDLTALPLMERKKILKGTVRESGGMILSEYVEAKGLSFFGKARDFGFEGIIAKRKDSAYEERRSRAWVKMKTLRTIDAIICGYTVGEGKRHGSWGSLVLGAYHEGELIYIGRVGTGFTEKMLDEMLRMMKPYETGKCPFGETPGMAVELASWMKPELVCEVEFLLVTHDLKLRAPAFKRMRFDKKPKECTIGPGAPEY